MHGRLLGHRTVRGGMDSFPRLILRGFGSALGRKLAYVAFAVLAVGVSFCAQAAGTVGSPNTSNNGYRVSSDFGGYSKCLGEVGTSTCTGPPQWFVSDSPAAVGAAYVDHVRSGGTFKLGDPQCTSASCSWGQCLTGSPFTCYNDAANRVGVSLQGGQTVTGCPANSAQVGSSCICNSGYTPDAAGTSCVPMSSACTTIVAAANSLGSSYSFTANVATPGGTTFCSGGCQIDATTGGFRKDGTQWVGTFLGPFTLVSSSCADAVPQPASPAACPAGQVAGTVNGSTVCYTPAVTAESTSTAASAPAGQASAPTATSTPNGTEVQIPPGGTVTRTTTCENGNCTTVTTVKNSGGTTTGSYTDKQDANQFCKENPDATICKKGTFGGSCTGGTGTFACDGDAVMCAMAKDQLLRHCQVFEATGTTRTVGEDAIARGDTRANDHPGALANIVTVGTGSSGFDQTDLIAGGGCPADQIVPLGSGSVVMPWSQLCTPAAWLGNLLVGLTALACAFIAFKKG